MYLFNYLVGFQSGQEKPPREYAIEISTRAFNLALPLGTRQTDSATTSMFGVVEHPSIKRYEWALIIPDGYSFTRHKAYTHAFNYQPLVDDLAGLFGVPTAEVEPIAQYIVNHNEVEVSRLIPASWQSRFLTQEQAQADGWLDDPE